MKIVVDVNGFFQGSIFDPLPKGTSRIVAEGETVRAALDDVVAQYPEFRRCLFFQEEKQIRRFVHLFLNDRELRTEAELLTPINEGDTIRIVPDVA